MRPKKKPATAGHRVGTKRSDMRFVTPDGQEWDSKYEAEVYASAVHEGRPVRRSVKGRPDASGSDTVAYWHKTRSGACRACGSTETGTSRSFTADLYHGPEVLPSRPANKDNQADSVESYCVDAKGYVRGPKRSLLRSLVKERPDINLRLLFQRNFPVTKKTSAVDWCLRTLKIPCAVWNGKWPTEWLMPAQTKGKKSGK